MPPMLRVARLVLSVLYALAVGGGSFVISSAAAAPADEYCARDHDHGTPEEQHHHADGTDCQLCCLGACVGAPVLPLSALASGIPAIPTLISYLLSTQAFAGRVITPDPAPPRPSV